MLVTELTQKNKDHIFVTQLNDSKPIPNERTGKNTSYVRIWGRIK